MKKFSIVHYTVCILITLSLFMQVIYYLNTGNFNSPVIPFEFAQSKKDVTDLFTINNKPLTDVIQGVDAQNRVDYFYMLSYSSLLILVFLKLKKHERPALNKIGIFLSSIALIMDICENMILFKVSRAVLNQTEFEPLLNFLILFTNLKWFSLALVFLILSFHYYNNRFAGKLFAILSILPLCMAFPSFFSENKDYDIYYAYSVMLAFIILIIRIFVSKFAENSIVFYKIKPLQQQDLNQSYDK